MCFLDRMLIIFSASWQRSVESVTFGELKDFGKNSTVFACLVDAVDGM